MGDRTSVTGRKPAVVLDANIATEANIELLCSRGYQVHVRISFGLKKYKASTDSSPVEVRDNKGQAITLQKVKVDNAIDTYLHAYSSAKQQKEESMN